MDFGRARVLLADPLAGQSMTQAARDALRRVDSVLAGEFRAAPRAIANLKTFSAALARNSDRVDVILNGLEELPAAKPRKEQPVPYDIKAPTTFPPPAKTANAQLVIPEPTALVTLDTQKIIVDPGAGQPPENAQWPDSLPKLLQARFIESFEKSRYVGAVARPNDSITPDFQLLIDIRKFEIEGTAAAPVAHVEGRQAGRQGGADCRIAYLRCLSSRQGYYRGRRLGGARRGLRQGRDAARDVGRRGYLSPVGAETLRY